MLKIHGQRSLTASSYSGCVIPAASCSVRAVAVLRALLSHWGLSYGMLEMGLPPPQLRVKGFPSEKQGLGLVLQIPASTGWLQLTGTKGVPVQQPPDIRRQGQPYSQHRQTHNEGNAYSSRK